MGGPLSLRSEILMKLEELYTNFLDMESEEQKGFIVAYREGRKRGLNRPINIKTKKAPAKRKKASPTQALAKKSIPADKLAELKKLGVSL